MTDLSKGRAMRGTAARSAIAAATMLLLGTAAGAQGHGGGGRPGGPGGGPGRGPGFPGEIHPVGPPSDSRGGRGSGGRNALQRGPAGRWWDETTYAHFVGLTGDQQRRMDSVFAENRGTLINHLDTLHKAEGRLNALSATDHPSEAALNAEIENVAQARADLEKANAHMLLQIRNEMTEDQLGKLDRLR